MFSLFGEVLVPLWNFDDQIARSVRNALAAQPRLDRQSRRLFELVFLVLGTRDVQSFRLGVAIAGLLTVAQFSFWGNYLPRVYPTYLRGTGESFAANIGGRMLGTSAALLTTQLVPMMPGAAAPVRLAYAAAVVGTVAYIIGFTASFWLPEPTRESLPD